MLMQKILSIWIICMRKWEKKKLYRLALAEQKLGTEITKFILSLQLVLTRWHAVKAEKWNIWLWLAEVEVENQRLAMAVLVEVAVEGFWLEQQLWLLEKKQ